MDRVVVEIREPGKEPRRVTMTASVEVGRDCSGVIVADSSASRRHAALTPSPGGLTVTDLGSRNGTLVNGARITGPVNVGPKDVVQIGETRLTLVGRTPPPAPSAKAPPVAATEVLSISALAAAAVGTTRPLPRPLDDGATAPVAAIGPHDLDGRIQIAHAHVTRSVPNVDLEAFRRAVLAVGLEHLQEVVARLQREG